MEHKKAGAIVLAAGQGKRMNSKIQKQFLLLNGKPLIWYALQAFEESDIDEIVLVVGTGEIEYCRNEIVEQFGFSKVLSIVEGGAERYHSVYEGLKAMKDCSYVLIHDGARPLVTPRMIADALLGAKTYHACVVGMPVKDTIKLVDADEFAKVTPDRTSLWLTQTPQAFDYSLILDAYRKLFEQTIIGEGITDDAMVVERMTECNVKMIRGAYSNIKVTTPEDISLATALLQDLNGR